MSSGMGSLSAVTRLMRASGGTPFGGGGALPFGALLTSARDLHPPHRLERRAELGREELRLFPRREVAALFDLVVVDEFRVCPLRPAPRGLVLLAGEHGHRNGNGDALGVEEAALVFPIEARRRDP